MDKTGDSKTIKDSDDRKSGARIKTFGKGNTRATLEDMWDYAPKEVVGLPIDRVVTNCYCKEADKKASDADIIERVIDHGPPLMNASTSKRIL